MPLTAPWFHVAPPNRFVVPLLTNDPALSKAVTIERLKVAPLSTVNVPALDRVMLSPFR